MEAKPNDESIRRVKRIKIFGRYVGVGQSTNGAEQSRKKRYSLDETVFEVDEKYVPCRIIGKGSYGVVCSSSNKETKEKVAIKKIKNVFENECNASLILREVKILRQIQHENIISLKDIMKPTDKKMFESVYLVFELMETDLESVIKSPQRLSDVHCKYFMWQILRGLSYLHSVGVLHRDIKPGNLLVNGDYKLKICDFGLARTCEGVEECMIGYVGTRWYCAPEILCGCEDYGAGVDMWSAGCVLAEILGREALFRGRDYHHQLEFICYVLGSPTPSDLEFINALEMKNYIESLPSATPMGFSEVYPDADPEAIDLLEKMLVFDPRKRITAKEALRHPYFSNFGSHSRRKHAPVSIDIEENVGIDVIRGKMWEEILCYHPDG